MGRDWEAEKEEKKLRISSENYEQKKVWLKISGATLGAIFSSTPWTVRNENQYCLWSGPRWKVKQELLVWNSGICRQHWGTDHDHGWFLSPGLLWWRFKICPSLMAEVILPASTKKRSKVSGNSTLNVHQCFGEAAFNSVSFIISLGGSNCDSPAQDCRKVTCAQDILWTVGLTGLYPLPADFHHVPEGPVSEKRLTL